MTRKTVLQLINETQFLRERNTLVLTGFVGDDILSSEEDIEGTFCLIVFKSDEIKKEMCSDPDYNKWRHNTKPLSQMEFVDDPEFYLSKTKNLNKLKAVINYIQSVN